MDSINITLNKNEVTIMFEDNFNEIQKLNDMRESKVKEAKKLDGESSQLKRKIRKMRIVKNHAKDAFSYTILCSCGVPYKTKKDPDAVIREERPQCPQCKIRMETKK